MRPAQLQSLSRITDAVFVAEQAKVREILEAEARLRRSISALTELLSAKSTKPGNNTTFDQSRLSGADILWRVHARRQLADLNMSLAQVLAVKQPRMAQLRAAFGRKEALRLLQIRSEI